MALHDTGMSRFAQWWKRELRAGHAFAHGAHRAAPERYFVRERSSVLLWGMLIPLATVVLVWRFDLWGLLALLLYPLQAVRLALRGTRSPRENWLRAVFLLIGKFPATLGILRFHRRHFLRQQPQLIEHK
jgi:hypothetical protein